MNTKRDRRLATLSVVVGVLVGASIGPPLLFFLWLLAIPIGLLGGGIAGGFWGRRNPITTTGFGSLGVLLAEAVFVLGERFVPLPTRAFTWFLAPIVGGLGLWLLPLLAVRLWPEPRTRENRAMVAALAFLVAPMAIWQLMPKSQIQADSESFNAQLGFFLKCDALAEAERLPATQEQRATELRKFPELRCPGVSMSTYDHEVAMGNWKIALHFVTKASFSDTVAYYQRVLPGATLRQSPVDVPFPCTRIDGNGRGGTVSVVVADVPERGVAVTLF